MDQCRTAGASSLTGQNLDEPPSNSGPDGDQAERCDGNLPFASRLMALLSMTGIGRRGFCRRRNPIFRP
jgi:hypothetical protein